MSGYAAQLTEEDARAAGAQAFLHKPVGTDEMRETLTRVLDE